MAELKIEIVEDMNGIIIADKISTERVQVSRVDVDAKKARIEELRNQINAAEAEIKALEEAIAADMEIIGVADAKREQEVVVEEQPMAEVAVEEQSMEMSQDVPVDAPVM